MVFFPTKLKKKLKKNFKKTCDITSDNIFIRYLSNNKFEFFNFDYEHLDLLSVFLSYFIFI
jgi:hypothetical protein